MIDIEMIQEKVLKVANQERNEKILVYPNDLEYDIFHSIMLAHYINYWGRPTFKKNIVKKDGDIPISVYYFENSTNNKNVVYFSTIGVSFQKKVDNIFQKQEFFMVLPKDSVKNIDVIIDYLLDICTHIIHNCDYQKPPSLIKSFVSPKDWNLDWILIDEPLGESEDFSQIPILFEFEPDILWVIPIHKNEAIFIKNNGIEAFENICREKSIDIINPNRDLIFDFKK